MIALTIPMALQNLINVGVTAADVLMLGKVGEKVLSGASLAGQIQFIMTLILMGITSGATVLCAQYWGKQDTKSIEKVLGLAILMGFIVSTLFAVLALTVPEYLMKIYASDKEVIEQGVKYLRIVGISYVFGAFVQVYLYVIRSVERVIIATIVYFISLLVNVMINAVLIFGLFGAPKLGVVGAAIGTLTARIVEIMIVLFYAIYKNYTVRIRLKNIIHIDKWLVRDFIRYALPVVINELFWGMGASANSAIIGHMGSAAAAANAITQVTRQLAMVVVFGVGNSTAIMLGKTIGEKRYDLAKRYGNEFLKISAILGLFGVLVILVVSPIARANLVLSPEAKEYLKIMFFVMCYFTFCMSMSSTMVVGIFRSGGDTRFGLILDMSTMWGCSILLGFIAAFVFKASVPVVYVILMCDEVIKLPICLKRYFSYKWLKDVTR